MSNVDYTSLLAGAMILFGIAGICVALEDDSPAQAILACFLIVAAAWLATL